MINGLQNVVQLISTLTTTEKQYFKKRYKKRKDYILLFDYINKNKTCSTKEVIKYLAKHNYEKREYTAGHISVLKKYLETKVLESLRSLYVSKNPNFRFLTNIIDINILIDRGLLDLASKEINQVKRKYFDFSFPIEKLLLLRVESVLHYYTNYDDSSLESLEELSNERRVLAEQVNLEIEFAHILSALTLKYLKGDKNMELDKSLLEVDFMRDETLSKDFSTKYLYHWVHALLAEHQGSPQKAFQHFENTINYWNRHPKFIEAHPKMYLGTCYAYLKYIIQQRNIYANFLKDIDFEDLLARLKNIYMPEDILIQYEQLFIIGKILSLRAKNNYQEIVNISNSTLEHSQSLISTNNFIKITLHYFLALSNFKLENYDIADKYLHDLVSDNDFYQANNPLLFSPMILLYLFTQYELGNEKHLKWLLKKYRKTLDKLGLFNEFEQLFFKFLAQLISPRFKTNRIGVYTRHRKEMESFLQLESLANNNEYLAIHDLIAIKERRLKNS